MLLNMLQNIEVHSDKSGNAQSEKWKVDERKWQCRLLTYPDLIWKVCKTNNSMQTRNDCQSGEPNGDYM